MHGVGCRARGDSLRVRQGRFRFPFGGESAQTYCGSSSMRARAKNFGCYGYDRDTTTDHRCFGRAGRFVRAAFSRRGLATTTSVSLVHDGAVFPGDEPRLGYVAGPGCASRRRKSSPLRGSSGKKRLRDGVDHFTTGNYLARECALGGDFESYVPVSDSAGVKASFEGLKEAALEWLWDHQDRPFFMYIHALGHAFPAPARPGSAPLGRSGAREPVCRRSDRGRLLGKRAMPSRPVTKSFLRSVYDESFGLHRCSTEDAVQGTEENSTCSTRPLS